MITHRSTLQVSHTVALYTSSSKSTEVGYITDMCFVRQWRRYLLGPLKGWFRRRRLVLLIAPSALLLSGNATAQVKERTEWPSS